MARHNRPFPRASSWPMRALRLYRISRGWTQAQLAARLGVRQGVVSEMEIGRLVPDTDFRNRIGEAFGVLASEIFPELGHDTLVSPPVEKENGGSS